MKKKNLVIIGIFMLFCFIYVAIFFLVMKPAHTTEGYIVVSNLGGFYCKYKQCDFVEIANMNLEQRQLKTYQQNQLKGIYELDYVDQWNFFQNNKWVSLYGDFLGFDTSLDVNLLSIEYEELTSEDRNFLKQILDEHHVTYETLDKTYALVTDIDQNGVLDRFISVSNQTEEETNQQYFSVFFALLNGKLIEIQTDFSNQKFDLPFYQVLGIFLLDNDKKPIIIVNKNYYDQTGEASISLYQYHNKTFNVFANGN